MQVFFIFILQKTATVAFRLPSHTNAGYRNATKVHTKEETT